MNNMDGPFGGPPEWDVIVAEVNRLREENQRLKAELQQMRDRAADAPLQYMTAKCDRLKERVGELEMEIRRLCDHGPVAW